MRKPFQRSPFFVRWLNWEFWPFNLVYLPVFAYVGWLGLRARSPLFFTAANPGIPTGGLVGESKRDILDMLPAAWKPMTTFLPVEWDTGKVLTTLEAEGLRFPIVLKPDVGERGMLVRVIRNAEELASFRYEHPVPFLAQEYIDLPDEVSVLHFRDPDTGTGQISSITLKKYLTVCGDGRRTVEQLVKAYPRALLQREQLAQSHAAVWNSVLPEGEILRFHTIGNHSKGCMFLDGRHLASPQLIRTFDQINASLDGVYYCRYDLKCANWDALESGSDFKILEINGVKSEPAHIYHPGYSIRRFYRDILWHWNIIYRISRANHRRGIAYMGVPEGIRRIRSLIRYHRSTTRQKLATAIPFLFLFGSVLCSCQSQRVREGREEGMLRDGLRQGEWTGYHFDGSRAWEGRYRRGKPVGNWTTWYEDGALHETFICKDSLRHGPYREYFPDGQLQREGTFEAGLWSGPRITYYEDGVVRENCSFLQGIKHGDERTFYPNGRLSGQFHWDMGSGEGAGFHPNGEVSYTGSWKEGRPDGRWQHFDAQGRLHHEELYREGRVISAY